MKNKYIITLCSGLLIVFAVSIMPNVASAAAGDITVTIKSELGYPVVGSGLAIWCTGGATTTISGVTNASGVLSISTSTLHTTPGTGEYAAASCAAGDLLNITATTTGYVSTTTYGNTYADAANAITATTSYSLKVTAMTSENDANVMPTSGIPFGPTTPAVGLITVASSTYYGGAWYLAASSTGATGGTLMATSSGYINNTITNVITSTSIQQTMAYNGGSGLFGPSSKFLYGLKVIVADQFGTSIIPQSASYRGTATTSSSGSTLYWANTGETAGVLNIIAPGYINATSTNSGLGRVTTSSTTQVVITLGDYTATTTPITISGTAKGLEAMLKISSFLDELGNSIIPTSGSPFSVSGALNLISQTYNSGVWYVAASSTDAVGGTLLASKDGYVSKSVASVLTSTTTQYTFNIGSSDGSTYNIVGLPFALKVTVTNSSGTNVSGSTVSAGDSSSVSCTENGVTGVYYCAIPIAQTGFWAKAVKSSYATGNNSYSDRSTNDDSQSTVTVTLGNLLISSGGGGSSYWSPRVTPSTTSIVPVVGCPAGFTCRPQATVSGVTVPVVGVSVASVSVASFTRGLTKGISGADVKNLQVILNSDKDTEITAEGAGSPGNETNFFGSLTMKAVQKFQVKYGIAKEGDEGYGLVGPKTRAKLNEKFGTR